jgi:hypothetical protein
MLTIWDFLALAMIALGVVAAITHAISRAVKKFTPSKDIPLDMMMARVAATGWQFAMERDRYRIWHANDLSRQRSKVVCPAASVSSGSAIRQPNGAGSSKRLDSVRNSASILANETTYACCDLSRSSRPATPVNVGRAFPKPEATQKGIGILSDTRLLWQGLKLVDIAAPDDHVVGFERGD